MFGSWKKYMIPFLFYFYAKASVETFIVSLFTSWMSRRSADSENKYVSNILFVFLTIKEWFAKHQEIQDIVDAYLLEDGQHLRNTRDWLLHYR